MDCFLDFCLACDKQTMDGFYCSQACRLADMEKAGSSAPASPSTSSPAEQDGWKGYQNSAFSMPAAFDFTSSKATSQFSPPRENVLSHSTSQSSLSSAASNMSTQASPTMSAQIQHELQGYVSSFDAVREMKRRSLSSNSGY